MCSLALCDSATRPEKSIWECIPNILMPRLVLMTVHVAAAHPVFSMEACCPCAKSTFCMFAVPEHFVWLRYGTLIYDFTINDRL